MHYHAELWLEEKPTDDALEGIVEEQLESSKDTVWDFWSLGGHWMNAHDASYDPYKDPRNHEPCDMCGGTGMRMDAVAVAARVNEPAYTCNGCYTVKDFDATPWERIPQVEGKIGTKVKWPTQWVTGPNIIVPITAVAENFTCAVLFVDGSAYRDEIWDGFTHLEATFKTKHKNCVRAALRDILSYRDKEDGFLVTLDLHN